MAGKGGQTIGFHYMMSLLSGLCRGPINELRGIRVGGKDAWTGAFCEGTGIINKPDLFGGEEKEGGIQGAFKLFLGAGDQILPGAEGPIAVGSKGPAKSVTLPSVKASIGGDVSELRGFTSLWFDGLVTSLNPYPKTWEFRLRRTTAGWFNNATWYTTKATIWLGEGLIMAMNPAHMIYQVATDPEWSRGLPADKIDENSFTYAANLFCDEGMGLCIFWYRKEEVEQFIQTVLDHAGALLYTDRETGKLVLRPLRGDYVVGDLPIFTKDSGLIDIIEDDTGASDTTYSEVIVTGKDPITNTDIQMRAHNLAAWQEQQSANTMAVDYPGFPTAELCGRAADRELRVHAGGLKKYRCYFDRRAWRIAPGSVFRVQAPERGVANVVLRAGEIKDGTFTDGRIEIAGMEDVFALSETSIVTPVVSTWVPPAQEAVEPLARKLLEAGYRDMYRFLGQTGMDTVVADDTHILQMAVAPNATSYEYDLATRADGEVDFVVRATGAFTGYALLTADILPLDTTFTTTGASGIDAALIIGQAIFCDDEEMLVVDYDEGTGEFTVERGTADTIPAEHLVGATVWSLDDDPTTDLRTYAPTEIVHTKVLTRTSSDVLDMATADVDTITLVGRQARPYPPADLQVDGLSMFGVDPDYYDPHAEPVLTWVERNRITQADQLIGHTDATVAPEAGQTYTVRVYSYDNVTLLNTYDTIAGTTWTYDAAMQTVDGDLPVVYMEVCSDRDGLESWQQYRFLVAIRDVLIIDGDLVLIDGEPVEF